MTVLLAIAEAALMYSLYNPDDLATTASVAAWTIILIYAVVELLRCAERARQHREQLHHQQQAEIRASMDAAVDTLVDALGRQHKQAVQDAVQLVRTRYDTDATQGGDRST